MAGDETLFTEAGLRRQITFDGLDYDEFVRCMTEERTAPIVQASLAEGESRGVTGTPSVFVNDQRVDPTFEAIEAAVEAALEETSDGVIDFGHREGLPFTRNVVGEPDAPVLIVEYSDFQ